MMEEFELTLGKPVHGGHCLARENGRVFFVRHGIEGERVRVRVSEQNKKSYARADVVEVLQASKYRRPSVWPQAGAGGVGGGELAHVTPAGQLLWKQQVVDDALARIGHLPDTHPVRRRFEVVAVAGEHYPQGLGYRTRIDLIADGAGRLGMYRYRTHEVLALESMPLAVAQMKVGELLDRRWQANAKISVVAPSASEPIVFVNGEPWRGKQVKVREDVEWNEKTFHYRLDGRGFWQIHRHAPGQLVAATIEAAGLRGGERVWDLYSGAGLLTLPLADAVGATGTVTGVEADRRGAQAAKRNAHGADQIRLIQADVASALPGLGGVDVVVMDPPRTGAGQAVMAQVCASGAKAIVYVACDPAALARDIATARDCGYELTWARGYDLFPNTHHVETVAKLEPASSK